MSVLFAVRYYICIYAMGATHTRLKKRISGCFLYNMYTSNLDRRIFQIIIRLDLWDCNLLSLGSGIFRSNTELDIEMCSRWQCRI